MRKRKLKNKIRNFLIITVLVIILTSLSIFLLISQDHKKKPLIIKIPTKTTEKVKDNKRSAKLTLVGDLLFEDPYYEAINAGEDKNKYFSLIKDKFENDDLTIGNMEVVIGNDSLKVSGSGYNFCAPKSIGELVTTLDFEVLSTANNHAYDRGHDGIISTIDFFKNNSDIMTVGTYKNKEDRSKLYIKEINGIKFGFLSYTYGTNIKANNEDSNLIAYYRDQTTKTVTDEYKEILKNEINEVKKHADIVIVSMHWGLEFTFKPNEEQINMAKYLNSLGVDIIVGSHSHSIQPIEIIGEEHKTLVYYSLGNFVSADDDIARTPKGEETFDNAYQFGLISTLNVEISEDNKVTLSNIKAEPVINYFDTNMKNFLLIPYSEYTEEYATTHYRYKYGLTKEFINNTYNDVIDSKYHIKTNN